MIAILEQRPASIMLVTTLSGEIEVEVSGFGSKRRFVAGGVVLVRELPSEKSHRTYVVIAASWKALFINIREASLESLLKSCREVGARDNAPATALSL